MSQSIRRTVSRLLVACAVVAAAATAPPVHAQLLYGSIVGTVTDAQGALIPGATVTIVNKETNFTREATTNEQGAYNLANVLPGPYDVTVALTGFREAVRTNVPVSIGQISRVDVRLDVGALTETVTVASAADLLQTDKADVSTEIKSDAITQMPLNRFRNYQALVNLVPGAMPMSFGNAETDTPARSMTTNINGQANTNNSTRTDGATNVNIWLPNHVMYVAPAETIDTVNVSTANFDAEQGMAGGAAITVITKSGTNNFRGSGFEFFNSDKLNATPYAFTACGFNCNAKSGKPNKLPIESNIFGGTLGGPIRRDKVFFFGSYDGFRRSNSEFRFFNVPDAAMRAGDLSRATNTGGTQQLIYNPFSTTATTGTGREPFAGNIIPANLIDPTALRILQLYPLPNVQGTGLAGVTNNFQRQEDRTFKRDNYDMKVNFNRTSAHQLWFKYSFMNAVVDDLSNYLGTPSNTETNSDGGFTKVYSFTHGQTWTISPTMLFDSTFGFAMQKQDVFGPDFNVGNFGLDVLGIPGTNDAGLGDARYAGYPAFNTGFSAVGNRDGWNPIFRDERSYSWATNLSKIVGRHNLRTGYTLNFLYLDHWQPESGNPRGSFSFAGNATALSGSQTANMFNTYAAFLTGLTSSVGKSVQNELMTSRDWQHALYFRDRWTPTPKLTLDLGLRWEYYPIMTRADGRGVERLDLDTLEVVLGGRGGNPRNVGLAAGKDNFAPRLGAVYRLNEETVLRTGYGVTYNNMGWGRPIRGDLQYPITLATTFTQPLTFMWYNRLGEGIPQVLGPDQSSGRVPLPNSVGMTTPELGNVDRGKIHTWNVAIERRLPLDMSVDIAYVGAKGVGGYAWVDVNLPTTYGGGAASRPYFISHGRQLTINQWGAILETRYDSLQVAINRPFKDRLMLKGAYTLSKSMNEGTDADGRTGPMYQHPLEMHRNWSRAGFDRPHNLQMGFVYQLPWQHEGNGYGNVAKAILGDWQLNGVFGAFSGTPFHVTASGTSLNTPGIPQTANFEGGDLRVLGNIGLAGKWFDTTQFSQPQGVTIGNVGRNQFRGPGAWTLDMSVFRTFPVGGQRRLEFRAEAGNIFNHPVFGNPNTDIQSGTFGQIMGIPGGGGTINANASYVERQIRLGLRFTF
ncbi:MAG: TonB-dependent receptor [Acidobacteria bacterium]|nr:TonB-dependent receptor [Acidobacteriota bacterium]